VEFVPIEIIPGQVEYPSSGPGAPWLVAGPYRKYETPLEGRSNQPFYYADFLTIPNHPELDGQFFNCYTEIRDDAPCQEFCPDNSVANSTGRGIRQLKRAFDSMVVGTLFTHDYYMYPIPNNPGNSTIIASTNWRATLEGITNGISGYRPRYVTLDYANQYARATRTSRITGAEFDAASGQVSLTLTGRLDLDLEVQIYLGEGNAISNVNATVAPFTNTTIIAPTILNVPPAILGQPQAATVSTGSNALFSVSVTGSTPFAYQWRVDAVDIPDATNASLALFFVQATNSGLYSVVVTNLAGAVTSSNALLTVILPPAITNEPQSQTVTAGGDVVLGVGVSGSAPLLFNWLKDATNFTGATAPSLELTNVQPADAGAYFVVVSNAAGAVTSSVAVVTVMLPTPPAPVLSGARVAGGFAISFASVPGYDYVVEYRLALQAGDWLTLTNVTATDTNTVVTDAIDAPQKYYRVRLAGVVPETIRLSGQFQASGFVLAFNARTGRSYTIEYQDGSGLWSSVEH
jgi:hypothetical protein